eukprot:gb/GEZN01012414.1/.p1 GENE.gb/GEZN01012414.1/~~gb/GEZN01012414.1/.p1  ORF type:complete len:284 (-),score=29.78 gb/GEZN01012414.1/:231-956(-)
MGGYDAAYWMGEDGILDVGAGESDPRRHRREVMRLMRGARPRFDAAADAQRAAIERGLSLAEEERHAQLAPAVAPNIRGADADAALWGYPYFLQPNPLPPLPPPLLPFLGVNRHDERDNPFLALRRGREQDRERERDRHEERKDVAERRQAEREQVNERPSKRRRLREDQRGERGVHFEVQPVAPQPVAHAQAEPDAQLAIALELSRFEEEARVQRMREAEEHEKLEIERAMALSMEVSLE